MRALPRPERRGRHPHCRPGEGLELQLEPHPDEQEQGADIDDPIDGVGRFHAEGVQDEPWDQKPPERGELHGRGNNDQGRATSSRGDDRRGIVTRRALLWQTMYPSPAQSSRTGPACHSSSSVGPSPNRSAMPPTIRFTQGSPSCCGGGSAGAERNADASSIVARVDSPIVGVASTKWRMCRPNRSARSSQTDRSGLCPPR